MAATKDRSASLVLHPKAAAATVGALVSTVALWALGKVGFNPPPDVVTAITGLISLGFAWAVPQVEREERRIGAAGVRTIERSA